MPSSKSAVLKQLIRNSFPNVFALYIQFLRRLDEVRIRFEARSIATRILGNLNNRNARVDLICDLTKWPPTLADFMIVAFLSKVLLSTGLTVRLVMINASAGFRLGSRMGQSANDLLQQWRSLAMFFCGSRNTCGEFVPPECLQFVELDTRENWQREKSSDSSLTIDPESSPLYVAASRILTHLWTHRGSIIPHEAFLIDDFALTKSELTGLKLPSEFVTWHIRQNFDSTSRNLTHKELQTLASAFSSLHLPTVVISTAAGYEVLDKALEGGLTQFPKLILLGEVGFQDSIRVAVSASRHYQFLAGGIGIGPAFSSTPYLSVQFSSGSVAEPKKGKLFPWSNEDQLYFLEGQRDKGFERFVNSLEGSVATSGE